MKIPPLGMIDDVLCVSECGHKTAMLNSFLKFQSDSKKLQFGVKKCKKLHVGHKTHDFLCPDLAVPKWEEVLEKDEINGDYVIIDSLDGEEIMEEKADERYLGEIISTDGRNIKNIKARITKGVGIVRKVLTILETIPFGRRHFEIGILLRDSLLTSSMLFNSETWYNVTNAELDLLETIDVNFLRQLLGAPKWTPTEML